MLLTNHRVLRITYSEFLQFWGCLSVSLYEPRLCENEGVNPNKDACLSSVLSRACVFGFYWVGETTKYNRNQKWAELKRYTVIFSIVVLNIRFVLKKFNFCVDFFQNFHCCRFATEMVLFINMISVGYS